ncbi:MAG: amino acid adenylation domain-containing protein, partial [Bacteroidota bacterium]
LLIRGVKKGDRLAILVPNSLPLVVAILATLKVGAAFVPIDASFPSARKQLILEDADATLLISHQAAYGEEIGYWPTEKIYDLDTLVPGKASSASSVELQANDLAYLIYTSGTTGRPKGVMIEHGNIVNYIQWAIDHYGAGGSTALSFPLFTSVAFDMTITSIFVPLLSGGTIHIYSQTDIADRLKQIFSSSSLDTVKLTPSHLKLLLGLKLGRPSDTSSIRRLIVGGEQLDTTLASAVQQWLGTDVSIYNEYGPTETTIGCIVHRFDEQKEEGPVVPIGSAIANTEVYVMDEHLSPVPIGVMGDLYIGGQGLGRGYHGQPQMTQQKFIAHPYHPTARLYRTGDTARWLETGGLEFCGRTDRQVKINGHRIELKEIEQVLLAQSTIRECAVIVQNKEKQKTQILTCFYVPMAEEEVPQLERILMEKLPPYMLPKIWVALEQLPLTPHGKLDERKLIEQIPTPETATDQAINWVEEKMLTIFKKVLSQEQIGIQDDFFALGGDSIKAVQISGALTEVGLSLHAKDILVYRTIQQLSRQVKKVQGGTALLYSSPKGEKALSPIERWFFTQAFEEPQHYHQSVLLESHRPLNQEYLEASFKALIQHHDGLRLNVDLPHQKVFYNDRHLAEDFQIQLFTLEDDHPKAQAAAIKTIGVQMKADFDLSKERLLRVAWIRGAHQADHLLIVAHHLLIDGLSWRILLEDFYRFYTSLEQEIDFNWTSKTAFLQEWVDHLQRLTGQFENQQAFWQAQLDTDFSLPLDFEETEWLEALKKTEGLKLSPDHTEILLKNGQQYYKADPTILIAVALCNSLKKWLNRSDWLIELEHHGRSLKGIDLSRTVGWLTSLYPLKLHYDTEDIAQQIIQVKEQIKPSLDKAAGFGVLRYHPQFSLTDYPAMAEIRLNYLGAFNQSINN